MFVTVYFVAFLPKSLMHAVLAAFSVFFFMLETLHCQSLSNQSFLTFVYHLRFCIMIIFNIIVFFKKVKLFWLNKFEPKELWYLNYIKVNQIIADASYWYRYVLDKVTSPAGLLLSVVKGEKIKWWAMPLDTTHCQK